MKKKIIISFGIILTVIIYSLINGIVDKEVSMRVLSKHPIYRINKEEKEVSITFDINWAEEEYIYEILEVLKENKIKATFFIMGGWVNYSDENREKLIQIVEDGHEIGNHSYIHPIFTNIEEKRIREEIEKTENIFQDVVGFNSNIFRFPSGAYDDRSLQLIETMGYKCIQWDVDSVDWKSESAESEYKRVIDNVKEGSIILFHNNAKYTPDNLRRIIPELKQKGYDFKTVGENIWDGEQIKK